MYKRTLPVSADGETVPSNWALVPHCEEIAGSG